MPNSNGSRFKNAWNAFFNKDPTPSYKDLGVSYSTRMDRPFLRPGNDRTIVTSIFNRIALDVAAVKIQHVKLDDNGRYIETVDSGLNECLNVEANIDQTGRAFIQDLVLSMLDEGCAAIVPVDTIRNPLKTEAYNIKTMRVGKIVQWYPKYVRVELYDENKGTKQQITLPKNIVGIIENPLYAVINERNSTMQRLIHKLSLLDEIDEQVGAGKLDLIIQLPYLIKSEARKKQAEERRTEIENQLKNSKYGIAYTDGTEHVVQLNRPIENNLLTQIEYLTSMLYSQLGITKEIMDGTANEQTMINYNNRTVEPIVSAITNELYRKFLSKTARTQQQSIMFFRDPFKLVPVSQVAEMADKFTRNEIMTSNEFRQIIGMKPSEDPQADSLRNKNMPISEQPYSEEYYPKELSEDIEVNDEY